MLDDLLRVLSSENFLPHGNCFLWNKLLLKVHVVSDALIAVSYFSIPFALAYFVWKRADVAYRWIFVLFAAFIMACGTSHAFDVWTLWQPYYGWQGLVKVVAAGFSFATALSLWVVMPKALNLPSPAQLSLLAARLRAEIAENRRVTVRLHSEAAERRSAVAALRESERRLELALAGADLGLWDWNIRTGAAVFNDRWATMLGYAPRDLSPQYGQWVDLIHPDDRDLVMQCLKAHLQGETALYEAEHRLRTKDGRWLWVLTRGRVFDRGGDGEPLRAAGTHMDISARKELEGRLQQQQDELCYAQRLMTAGELAATMAHELNQPLGAIANYAGGATLRFREILEANPALGEVMQTMLKLSNRASAVVSGIRDLVHRNELRRDLVHVDTMLHEVLPLIHGDMQRKQVRLSLSIEPDLPPVWGQSIHLQQLVLNLVLNAIDAMDSADIRCRDLRLWARRCDGQIEIGISDTGPGFDPAVGERLFQPFVSTKPDGMGLGLSVCRTIVEAHGGTIRAVSKPGSGVTWHVLLPSSPAGHDYAG